MANNSLELATAFCVEYYKRLTKGGNLELYAPEATFSLIDAEKGGSVQEEFVGGQVICAKLSELLPSVKTAVKSVLATTSHEKSVLVLVTGVFSRADAPIHSGRAFSHSFVLAPSEAEGQYTLRSEALNLDKAVGHASVAAAAAAAVVPPASSKASPAATAAVHAHVPPVAKPQPVEVQDAASAPAAPSASVSVSAAETKATRPPKEPRGSPSGAGRASPREPSRDQRKPQSSPTASAGAGSAAAPAAARSGPAASWAQRISSAAADAPPAPAVTLSSHSGAASAAASASAAGARERESRGAHLANGSAAVAPASQAQQHHTIFVRGLPEHSSEAALSAVFKTVGVVTKVSINARKNVAYVEFDSAAAVEKAISKKTFQLGEQELSVEASRSSIAQIAVARPRREGGERAGQREQQDREGKPRPERGDRDRAPRESRRP